MESALSKINELAAEIEALSLKQTNAEREIGNNKTTINDLHAEKEDLISQNNSISVKISEQAQEILSLRKKNVSYLKTMPIKSKNWNQPLAK